MSFTNDLLVGVAEHLAAEGVGAWRPTGTYTAGEVAIVMRGMPQSPDRVISLSPYPVTDDVVLNDSTIGVQAMTRAPADVEALDDALFDVLHGAHGLVLNGVHVVQVYRQSNAPMGQDGNRRWQSVSNFYFDVAHPTRHRTD